MGTAEVHTHKKEDRFFKLLRIFDRKELLEKFVDQGQGLPDTTEAPS